MCNLIFSVKENVARTVSPTDSPRTDLVPDDRDHIKVSIPVENIPQVVISGLWPKRNYFDLFTPTDFYQPFGIQVLVKESKSFYSA